MDDAFKEEGDGPFEKVFEIGEGMDTNEPVEEPAPKPKKAKKGKSPVAVRLESGRIVFE